MKDNIRKAIRREDESRHPMPKDLNARLMQRVEKELNSKPLPRRKRIIWLWVAAACVAAVIIIVAYSPKGEPLIGDVAKETKKKEAVATKDSRSRIATSEQESQHFIANIEREKQGKERDKAPVADAKKTLLAKTECMEKEDGVCKIAQEVAAQAQEELTMADNTTASPTAKSVAKPRFLTERDIPITRPENLKYTKEELALMKRQANEAYLKWVELELEIARYNQQQTALQ